MQVSKLDFLTEAQIEKLHKAGVRQVYGLVLVSLKQAMTEGTARTGVYRNPKSQRVVTDHVTKLLKAMGVKFEAGNDKDGAPDGNFITVPSKVKKAAPTPPPPPPAPTPAPTPEPTPDPEPTAPEGGEPDPEKPLE